MKTGFKHMAQRTINAESRFVVTVQEISGCTKAEAEKVLSVYRKAKVVKMDPINGVINVTHGAFMDVRTIQNAINA